MYVVLFVCISKHIHTLLILLLEERGMLIAFLLLAVLCCTGLPWSSPLGSGWSGVYWRARRDRDGEYLVSLYSADKL